VKKIAFLCIAFLFVLSTAGMSFAAEKEAGKEEGVKVTKMINLVGQVKGIDVEGKIITVTKKQKDTVIALDDETKIVLGQDKKVLSDVKVGDRVSINYTTIGTKKLAKKVSISFKKKAKLETSTK
jgi:Cu/Ag efflux protein CusF